MVLHEVQCLFDLGDSGVLHPASLEPPRTNGSVLVCREQCLRGLLERWENQLEIRATFLLFQRNIGKWSETKV